MRRPRTWFVVAFVAYAVLVRLLPWLLRATGVEIPIERMVYPWNFVPLTALCLFAGAHFRHRAVACLCPLLVMLVTDTGIGLLGGSIDNAFHSNTLVVYAAFVLSTSLGMLLRGERTAWTIGGTAVAAETLFFLVTNVGVWSSSGMYSHDLGGLAICFEMALPFFRNSLLATAVFTPIVFSSLALLPRDTPAYARVRVENS
ncbi:MAG: hypothetical protein CMJ65_17860 [Planctomycetaceae bacterium]|jgi:hypothetical protein|nr:hypothetical protein [Planctomycetaceae bacterium]MDP7277922.1 hypothetical protein [Planctomycetaceae bacterium]